MKFSNENKKTLNVHDIKLGTKRKNIYIGTTTTKMYKYI